MQPLAAEMHAVTPRGIEKCSEVIAKRVLGLSVGLGGIGMRLANCEPAERDARRTSPDVFCRKVRITGVIRIRGQRDRPKQEVVVSDLHLVH